MAFWRPNRHEIIVPRRPNRGRSPRESKDIVRDMLYLEEHKSPLEEFRRRRVAMDPDQLLERHNKQRGGMNAHEELLQGLAKSTTDATRRNNAAALCKNCLRTLDNVAKSQPPFHASLDVHTQALGQLGKQILKSFPEYNDLLDRLIAFYSGVAAEERSSFKQLKRQVATLEEQLRTAREDLLEGQRAASVISPGVVPSPSPAPNVFRRWRAQSAAEDEASQGDCGHLGSPKMIPAPQDVFDMFMLLTPLEQREMRGMMAEARETASNRLSAQPPRDTSAYFPSPGHSRPLTIGDSRRDAGRCCHRFRRGASSRIRAARSRRQGESLPTGSTFTTSRYNRYMISSDSKSQTQSLHESDASNRSTATCE